jgi:hypothetical protein
MQPAATSSLALPADSAIDLFYPTTGCASMHKS